MTATEARRGSAELQGRLWGADAEGWAGQEDRQRPVYEEVLARAGLAAGTRLLDVGCGSGGALAVAAALGARVAGLDASASLVELARRRVPEADVRVGDIHALPFGDASFDVVTGFNSFQFADEVGVAMGEAARVVKPGGRVAVQVWGRPQRCELLAAIGALAPFLPGPPPAPPGGGNWSDPGVLESVVAAAGLRPEAAGDVTCTFEYADEAALMRALLSAGLAVLAVERGGEAPVREALARAAAPFEDDDGVYRFENEWHWLIARR